MRKIGLYGESHNFQSLLNSPEDDKNAQNSKENNSINYANNNSNQKSCKYNKTITEESIKENPDKIIKYDEKQNTKNIISSEVNSKTGKPPESTKNGKNRESNFIKKLGSRFVNFHNRKIVKILFQA